MDMYILFFLCFSFILSIKNVYGATNETLAASEELTVQNSTDVVMGLATVTTSTTNRPFFAPRLPCNCQSAQCGCCTGVILDVFKQKACINITYEPDEFGFLASMSMNGKVLYSSSISGKNPPPMCVRVPRFRFIQMCVKFSNVYFAQRNMHACIDMEANWEDLTLLDFSFDCVRVGIGGVAVVSPEDGGGVPVKPIDQESEIDEDYDDNARTIHSTPNFVHRLRNGDFVVKLDN